MGETKCISERSEDFKTAWCKKNPALCCTHDAAFHDIWHNFSFGLANVLPDALVDSAWGHLQALLVAWVTWLFAPFEQHWMGNYGNLDNRKRRTSWEWCSISFSPNWLACQNVNSQTNSHLSSVYFIRTMKCGIIVHKPGVWNNDQHQHFIHCIYTHL